MENLNAENITNEIKSLIKALKDCGGWVKRGNGEGWFNHEILADALALINSQEQRMGAQDMTISELRQRAEKAEHDANRYAQRIKELAEENEKLTTMFIARAEDISRLSKEKKMLEGRNDNT